jgi:hypothetical protein
VLAAAAATWYSYGRGVQAGHETGYQQAVHDVRVTCEDAHQLTPLEGHLYACVPAAIFARLDHLLRQAYPDLPAATGQVPPSAPDGSPPATD